LIALTAADGSAHEVSLDDDTRSAAYGSRDDWQPTPQWASGEFEPIDPNVGHFSRRGIRERHSDGQGIGLRRRDAGDSQRENIRRSCLASGGITKAQKQSGGYY
jgi:hypothetical protein